MSDVATLEEAWIWLSVAPPGPERTRVANQVGLARAQEQLQQRAPGYALLTLEQALAWGANDAQLVFYLAELALTQGKPSIRYWRALQATGSVDAQLGLAEALALEGQPQQAMAMLEPLTAHGDAWVVAALASRAMGQTGAFVEFISQAGGLPFRSARRRNQVPELLGEAARAQSGVRV